MGTANGIKSKAGPKTRISVEATHSGDGGMARSKEFDGTDPQWTLAVAVRLSANNASTVKKCAPSARQILPSQSAPSVAHAPIRL